MTTRSSPRLVVVFLAILSIALIAAAEDADAVTGDARPESTWATAPGAQPLQARKGRKRRGRAAKKRPKKNRKKKKDDAKKKNGGDTGEDKADVEEEELLDDTTGGGIVEEPKPKSGGGLRKKTGAGLEPKPSLGTEGVPMTAGSGLRRSRRMEFDARVVRGETAGSGAVILFERGPRHLAPLTKKRTRFLDATIEQVFGKEAAVSSRREREKAKKKKKPVKSKEKAAGEETEKKPDNGKKGDEPESE